VGGRDEHEGAGLDPDRHADHHRRDDAEPGSGGLDPLDLIETVDDDLAHTVGECLLDLRATLVVAAHPNSLGGHAGAPGDRDPTTGCDVEPEAFIDDPSGDLGAQERLAGVVDVGTTAYLGERTCVVVAEGAGTAAEVLLVEDVGRGAELGSDRADVEPT